MVPVGGRRGWKDRKDRESTSDSRNAEERFRNVSQRGQAHREKLISGRQLRRRRERRGKRREERTNGEEAKAGERKLFAATCAIEIPRALFYGAL